MHRRNTGVVNRLLDSLDRRTGAESAFHRALIEYSLAIRNVLVEKGTRLGVYFSGVLENSNTPLSQGLTLLGRPHNTGPPLEGGANRSSLPSSIPPAGFFQQPAGEKLHSSW